MSREWSSFKFSIYFRTPAKRSWSWPMDADNCGRRDISSPSASPSTLEVEGFDNFRSSYIFWAFSLFSCFVNYFYSFPGSLLFKIFNNDFLFFLQVRRMTVNASRLTFFWTRSSGPFRSESSSPITSTSANRERRSCCSTGASSRRLVDRIR